MTMLRNRVKEMRMVKAHGVARAGHSTEHASKLVLWTWRIEREASHSCHLRLLMAIEVSRPLRGKRTSIMHHLGRKAIVTIRESLSEAPAGA